MEVPGHVWPCLGGSSRAASPLHALAALTMWLLAQTAAAPTDWHHLELHDEYALAWTFDDSLITFEVTVNTTGWVGFGLSPHGSMAGADIVVGWVDDQGRPYLIDCHGVGNMVPEIDARQDYVIVAGSENEAAQTTIRFHRNITTCDADDFQIDDSTSHVMFAWGPRDPAPSLEGLAYHGTHRRGSKAAMLLLHNLPDPDERQHATTLPYFDAKVDQVRVPPERTVYWCRIIKLPTFSKKHHIVKVVPMIEPANQAVVHHMVIYFCHGDLQEDEYGRKCWEGRMPENSTDCDTLAYGWAVGQQEFHYPAEAGMSIGGPDDPGFFHIEMHYDNVQERHDIVDSSGLRFYYTSEVREHDAGTFLVGHSVWWPPLAVPPGAKDFRVDAYCASSCTRHLPSDGITVFAMFPHTHLVGSGVKSSLIRGGKEVHEIIDDRHYDFNFQYLRNVKEPFKIMPGDEMHTTCTFDTRGRDNVTFGGPATSNEMCFLYMTYFPRTAVQTCVSTVQAAYPVMQLVMEKAMIGELSIDPGSDVHPYKHLNELKWTAEDIARFQTAARDVFSFQQFCTLEKQGFGVFGGGESTIEEKLSYVKKERVDVCSKTEQPTRKQTSSSSGQLAPRTLCLIVVMFALC